MHNYCASTSESGPFGSSIVFNPPPAPRIDLVPVVTGAPCRLLVAYGSLWILLVG